MIVRSAATGFVISVALLGLSACQATQQSVAEPRADAVVEAPPAADPLPSGEAQAMINLGYHHLATGDLATARRAFTRAVRLGGPSVEALTGLGMIAERQSLLTEARKWFEAATEAAPDSEIAHNNLGAILYRLKDYYGARHAFRTAFALSSGRNRVAEHNLGLTNVAIADQVAETPVLAENPITVQRIGSSHFRLVPAEKLEQDG